MCLMVPRRHRVVSLCNDQGGAPSSDHVVSSPSKSLAWDQSCAQAPPLDLRSPTTHPLGVQRGEIEGRGQSKGSESVPRESERPHRQKLT